MLKISKVDPEFKIYKEATTVLFGCGKLGKKTGMMFERFGIPISYYCDNNSDLWGSRFRGVPVISPEDLKTLAGKEKVVVQLAVGKNIHSDVLKQIKDFPLAELIWYGECRMIFSYYHRCNLFSASTALFEECQKQPREFFKRKNTFINFPPMRLDDSSVFVHMVGKTGDTTIIETLNQQNVSTFRTHNPDFFPDTFFPDLETVKIITAIRDPLSIDVSSLYQLISKFDQFFLPLEFYKNKEVDVQTAFDTFFHFPDGKESHYGYHPYYNEECDRKSTVDRWFEAQGKRLANVLDHPFDQEKGHTIIKEGKYEIFFYQLEKLNDLIPELSEWVGVPFDKLVNANEASSKWLAESYKQAQTELKFSQAYFDRCYDSPYIQHCYSPEDIEKFKAR